MMRFGIRDLFYWTLLVAVSVRRISTPSVSVQTANATLHLFMGSHKIVAWQKQNLLLRNARAVAPLLVRRLNATSAWPTRNIRLWFKRPNYRTRETYLSSFAAP